MQSATQQTCAGFDGVAVSSDNKAQREFGLAGVTARYYIDAVSQEGGVAQKIDKYACPIFLGWQRRRYAKTENRQACVMAFNTIALDCRSDDKHYIGGALVRDQFRYEIQIYVALDTDQAGGELRCGKKFFTASVTKDEAMSDIDKFCNSYDRSLLAATSMKMKMPYPQKDGKTWSTVEVKWSEELEACKDPGQIYNVLKVCLSLVGFTGCCCRSRIVALTKSPSAAVYTGAG